MNVLAHADIANFIKLALYRMPAATEIQGDLTQAKIELLRRTVDTPLFSAQGKDINNIQISRVFGNSIPFIFTPISDAHLQKLPIALPQKNQSFLHTG